MKSKDEIKIPPYSEKETVEYTLNQYKFLCKIFTIIAILTVILGSVALGLYCFSFKNIIVIDYIAIALYLIGLVMIVLFFVFDHKLSHYFKNQEKKAMKLDDDLKKRKEEYIKQYVDENTNIKINDLNNKTYEDNKDE